MRYAAIGDSFTEGVGDERPDGSVRGWADRVAEGLWAARGGGVEYANLAVRGRLLGAIATEQLEAALALRPAPTLVTLNGGGNDMLRRSVDVARLVGLTERAVRRCEEAGVRLVLLSGADPSARLPFGRTVRQRGQALGVGIARVARAHGVEFVDVFADSEIRRAQYWSADRLHLNGAGHQRVAELVLRGLGAGLMASTAGPEAAAARRALAEARYYREHVLPWVRRHLRGRSSGDGRLAKHPDWIPLPIERLSAVGP